MFLLPGLPASAGDLAQGFMGNHLWYGRLFLLPDSLHLGVVFFCGHFKPDPLFFPQKTSSWAAPSAS